MLKIDKPVISRLKELMQKQQLDPKQLSLVTNIPLRKLSGYLEGEEELKSLALLERICQALGTTISDFFKPNTTSPSLNDEEKRLLLYYQALPYDKQEVFMAFLKGCKCNLL